MEIKEIQILTDKIEETNTFYSQVLGFQRIHESAKIISLEVGTSVLTFIESENLKPKYHFAFNIPCNKIEEAIKWVSSKIEIINVSKDSVIANFDKWNARAFYFYDNNENILEFIARYDLNVLEENPFTVLSVQSISEVGLVTDEPIASAHDLIKANGLACFLKDAMQEDFVPLGNDNGLLIMTKTNRNWYPTRIPANKFFTKITLKVNDAIAEIVFNEKNTSRHTLLR